MFKTLYSEVNHYFLPDDGNQVTAAVSSRHSNTKEVETLDTLLCPVLSLQALAIPLTLFPSFPLPSGFPTEEAAGASGLPGQREAGAHSRSDLQVQSCRDQLLWSRRLQPSQRVQDLSTWLPWSALCCQDHQGDILTHVHNRLGNMEKIFFPSPNYFSFCIFCVGQ